MPAKKKSPAQLQREIDEVLATPLVLHGDRWISQKEAAARGAFDPKLYEKAVAEGRVPPAVATRIAKAAERPQRAHATKSKYSSRQIGGYLKAVREPLGISHNDNYNKATYGITKAEYDEINRAMHAKYGMFPERTTAGVRKALEERY